MKNYTDIFRKYKTKENIPFLLLNKRIAFPDDRTLFIYDNLLIDTDIPWTVLSYRIYGTIDYWWVLNSLNPTNIFYAKESTYVTYIKPEYLDYILSNINNA